MLEHQWRPFCTLC